MINTDEKSNAQSWELEVTCKNKKYLDAVVGAILAYDIIEFEVKVVDSDNWGTKYTVLMWCSWFNNLKAIAKDLAKIEKNLDS